MNDDTGVTCPVLSANRRRILRSSHWCHQSPEPSATHALTDPPSDPHRSWPPKV